MPGGVNSPVRAFKGVGGTPRFMDHGSGPHLFDVDGNRYLDYVLSWGPLVLGHAHPSVCEAIIASCRRGTSFGAPTHAETMLAKTITSLVPSIQMIRFVSSGTEACMSAIRLARAYTKRQKILKFSGGYHGHADLLLTDAGSGVATLGLPNSPGVPENVTHDTIVVAYNDLEAVRSAFTQFPDQIAAVILEPVAGNMGLVTPVDGFLQGLSSMTKQHHALLIFDEVMTGFRAALPGVQAQYQIVPDLTCLGKVIGGGLPVAAYGGRRDIMQMIAPIGPVYQAGTLSGNPLGMAAGLSTLTELVKPGVFESAARYASELVEGMKAIAHEQGVGFQADSIGTMFGFFFLKDDAPRDAVIRDYGTAKKFVDTTRYSRFFHAMLTRGHYFAPSAFEAAFMSTTHSREQINETLQSMRDSAPEWTGR
jgi:glutamate-1-semialdehyde 2,1-aminomutase